MEKIKQTIEIDRYELRRNEMDYHYTEPLEEVFGIYGEDTNVYFNENHSGLRDFSNFLAAESIYFEDVEMIEKIMEEKGFKFYTVVSFYRENGYDGVYTRTGKDSLTVRCNNWVNFGKDGLLFVVMSKTQEKIDKFIEDLQIYIQEGYYCIEVLDNKNEEFVDSYCNIPLQPYEKYREWKEKCIKEYGFKEKDFEII